jgi:hypothetical protein
MATCCYAVAFEVVSESRRVQCVRRRYGGYGAFALREYY